MSFPSSDGKSIMYSYNHLMFLYMILQAGMFSAISFTRSNSKTMMAALLARLPEESGLCPGCRLFLWGTLKTRGQDRVLSAVLRKGHKMIIMFTYASTFHFTKQLHSHYVDWDGDNFLLPLYWWENWLSEILSNLPKAFQLFGLAQGLEYRLSDSKVFVQGWKSKLIS